MNRRTFLSLFPALAGASCADMAIIQNSLKSVPRRVPAPPPLAPRGNYVTSDAGPVSLGLVSGGSVVAASFDATVGAINIALFCSDYPTSLLARSRYTPAPFFGTTPQPISEFNEAIGLAPQVFGAANITQAAVVTRGEIATITAGGVTVPAYIGGITIFNRSLVTTSGGATPAPFSLELFFTANSGVIAGEALYSDSPTGAFGQIILRAQDYSQAILDAGNIITTASSEFSVVGLYDPVVL